MALGLGLGGVVLAVVLLIGVGVFMNVAG